MEKEEVKLQVAIAELSIEIKGIKEAIVTLSGKVDKLENNISGRLHEVEVALYNKLPRSDFGTFLGTQFKELAAKVETLIYWRIWVVAGASVLGAIGSFIIQIIIKKI